METVTDTPKRVSPRTLSNKPRCRATSRQTKEPCRSFPMPGKTLCKHHGGPTEKVSATHLVTHGLNRKYFHEDEFPELLEQVESLKTTEGRKAILMRGVAVTEHRARKVPDSPEHLDSYVKARGSVRGDIALLEDMEAEVAAPQLPVFNIAIGDAASHAPFAARSLEGQVTMRMLDGQPFMLDVATGGWMPAQLRKDDDSGAEYYERVIAELPPSGETPA